jgi:hypothetical protein
MANSTEAGKILARIFFEPDIWHEMSKLCEDKLVTREMAYARVAIVKDAISRFQPQDVAPQMLAGVQQYIAAAFPKPAQATTAMLAIQLYQQDVLPLTRLADAIARRIFNRVPAAKIAAQLGKVTAEADALMKVSLAAQKLSVPTRKHPTTTPDQETQPSEAETSYAFSDEVMNGFKNKFGKFYGTDHLVSEGWLSYQTSMKPQSGDDAQLCFYSGAMAMFKTMLEIFSTSDKERALKRISVDGPSKLWAEYRACIADEIDTEILNQYKKAFYGGTWFINATFMAIANERNEGDFVEGMEAIRDELNECRANIKQSIKASTSIGTANSKTEFVLKLSDALAQSSKQPTSDTLEMMASTFMISLEYEKISEICCPQCGKRKVEPTERRSLDPRKDLDWPYLCPGGDEHRFLCTSCTHSFPVTFWFTK